MRQLPFGCGNTCLVVYFMTKGTLHIYALEKVVVFNKIVYKKLKV